LNLGTLASNIRWAHRSGLETDLHHQWCVFVYRERVGKVGDAAVGLGHAAEVEDDEYDNEADDEDSDDEDIDEESSKSDLLRR
jgi:hypothetical protein